MTLLFQWGNPDPINLVILIVYSAMAFLMWKTFKEGQRQSNISLSISQFDIFNKEFEGFLLEAKNIKFKSELEDVLLKPFRNAFEKSNGIYYVELFTILHTIKYYDGPSDEKGRLVNDFRSNVLFPLARFYDKVYHFLQRIQIDKTVNPDHKKILYYYIERDLLQSYFRVCNYGKASELYCSIREIETTAYTESMFHEINNFYETNSLFQFKDIAFYEKTF